MNEIWISAYLSLFTYLMIALGKRNILSLGLSLGLWRPWPWASILFLVSNQIALSAPVSVTSAALFQLNKRAFCFLSALVLLHTVISVNYRFRMAPSSLEWVDMGIGIVTISWIIIIRRNNSRVKPVQPAMCWSSFFSQLYEMSENGEVSRTQLEDDIEAFLRPEWFRV